MTYNSDTGEYLSTNADPIACSTSTQTAKAETAFSDHPIAFKLIPRLQFSRSGATDTRVSTPLSSPALQ